MIHIFYGTEEYLIKEKIAKIKEQEKIDDVSINSYNLEETIMENILEDATTVSLFSDKKMIVVENAYIFTGTVNKKLPEQNVKILEDYIKHDNINTILLFSVLKEKLDERKKIVKLLREKKQITECNKPSNLNKFIQNEFGPYEIGFKEIAILIDRVGENLALLHQEIEKIKIYKNDNMKINKEDIINLTSKTIDTDIFNLIENIVDGNMGPALESYKEMIRLGEEPIKIIVMLANQFRLIYQIRNLYKKGYTEKDISAMLEVHPYRIKISLTKANKFQDEELLKYLEKLSELDIDIKTGKIDKEFGLELFILKAF